MSSIVARKHFETFCHLRENRDDWVVRVQSLHRAIERPSGENATLNNYLSELSAAGRYGLWLRARSTQPARTANLEVRFGALSMPIPRKESPYVKALKPQPIEQHVVWVREIDPSNGLNPIEWVLYTSIVVNTLEDALIIIAYYECRRLIEEFHKALKAGCRVQRFIAREADQLKAVAGLTSMVAVRAPEQAPVGAAVVRERARESGAVGTALPKGLTRAGGGTAGGRTPRSRAQRLKPSGEASDSFMAPRQLWIDFQRVSSATLGRG